jgi:hypothetical protein
MHLELGVQQVQQPGTLVISCPPAQIPTTLLNITGPGDHDVGLGPFRWRIATLSSEVLESGATRAVRTNLC